MRRPVGTRSRRKAVLIALVSALLAWPRPAPAAPEPEQPSGAARVPVLSAAPSLGELAGRPLVEIRVVTLGRRWVAPVRLERVRLGQSLSPELVRTALQELLDGGRYAEARATVEATPRGAVLVIEVLPRRIVAEVETSGAPVAAQELLAKTGLRRGADVTAKSLPIEARRVEAELVRRGYPRARVTIRPLDTDDALEVVLVVEIRAGPPLVVHERWFAVWPDPNSPGMQEALSAYQVGRGHRADAEALEVADRELETELRARGYHEAKVGHRLAPRGDRAELTVDVRAGPLVRLVFEGNRRFDAAALEAALELSESEEREPNVLVDRLIDFYVAHGLFDVEVKAERRGALDDPVRPLAFLIREGRPVRVVAREYPCLGSGTTPADVGSEIDSFLSELPGSELFGAVDADTAHAAYGPNPNTSRHPEVYAPSPWTLYVPEVYDRAVEHLRDLFRSRGYLSATVGPPALVRRACDPRSPAGQCRPVGPRRRPTTICRYDEVGVPLEEPPVDPELTCRPDPKRGRSCETEAVLHLPIKLGPRTMLYDVGFEGNSVLVESELARTAALEIGAPVSHLELDRARRRLLDAYAEEAFAFAEVETALDLSHDHTRGRVRFIISERERVSISRIDVRGARTTSESLIRSRIALESGGLYRKSLVRLSEERLGQLGVFASISVGLEDPYVPAREKVVVVALEENKPQSLTVRPGFATGEGFRISFEYGHRNIAGQAVQLTLASRLNYLPTALILEGDVRRKYDELDLGERLERRNTATVEFPEIGLGPLFRLSVQGVDVRDNARDYGLTKDAAIVTLHFRPAPGLWFQIGGSLERNDARIFGSREKGVLAEYLANNRDQERSFRVPEGTTRAIAERVGVTWDRRDYPLDATSGTVVSLDVEHVNAKPIEEDPANVTDCDAEPETVFSATCSDFMRYQSRIGGYVRLSKRGLSFAVSYRAGVIQHLRRRRFSRTYPDRLFFLGGVDSVRGFAQDSLVPEDVAEQLLDPDSGIGIRDVVIRGGDAYVNPRAELRIPLSETVQTALFVDAGNLWTDPSLVEPFDLRYSTGSGIRVKTPIGPLVFDYGFNVDRVLDRLFPSRGRQRTWEALGAFHFSIGVF